MRIAVTVVVFLVALAAGAKTEWVALPDAAPTMTGDRAYAAVVLGETSPDATSAELIDAAVSRGEISPEYGLLYGVFLACDSERLPHAYRSQASGAMGRQVLWEPDVEWSSLSPDVRATLTTFFSLQLTKDAASACAEDVRRLAKEADLWWAAAVNSDADRADYSLLATTR